MISPTTGGENTTHLMTKQAAKTLQLASESKIIRGHVTNKNSQVDRINKLSLETQIN